MCKDKIGPTYLWMRSIAKSYQIEHDSSSLLSPVAKLLQRIALTTSALYLLTPAMTVS